MAFNDSRTPTTVSLTKGPMGIGNTMGATPGHDGEGWPVGSSYSATLSQRTNKSNPRNQGPTGPSANSSSVPVVSMGIRKTARV